jgi:hypothetical protein
VPDSSTRRAIVDISGVYPVLDLLRHSRLDLYEKSQALVTAAHSLKTMEAPSAPLYVQIGRINLKYAY